MMDNETKQKIEAMRGEYSESNAQYLKQIAIKYGLPVPYTCFCKYAYVIRYMESFYVEYDKYNNNNN